MSDVFSGFFLLFVVPVLCLIAICWELYKSYREKKEEKKRLEKYYRRYPWVRPRN